MSFGQAFRTCMRKYTRFQGRARRSEFWWFYLAVVIINAPLQFLMAAAFTILWTPVWAGSLTGENADVGLGDLWWGPLVVAIALAIVVQLIFLLPLLAAESRRLHDAGQPGTWALLNLVGLGIVPLVMCVLEPQVGANEYGLDPREPIPAN